MNAVRFSVFSVSTYYNKLCTSMQAIDDIHVH